MASAEPRPLLRDRLGPWPCLAIAGALLLLGGMSASAALASTMARRAPAAAADVWPVNGFATSSHAAALLAEATRGSADVTATPLPRRIERLALAALRAEPSAVEAVRSLALYYRSTGDQERARVLMQSAARLSRRDTVVNLFLVEEALRAGDLERAGELFDIALRTDTRTSAVLLPQLARLLAEPEAEAFLGDLLQKDPPWQHDFWSEALKADAVPVAAVRIRMGLHESGQALAPGHDARLIARLVEARDFVSAFALYRAADRAQPHAGTQPARFAPIDWQFIENGKYGASEGAGGEVSLEALAGAGGVVAQKIIALPRGRYVLSGGSDASGGDLLVRLVCAEMAGERTFASLVPLASIVRQDFVQDSACRYMWLSILLEPSAQDRSISIAPISIRRLEQGA